jgi:hypothetical protein
MKFTCDDLGTGELIKLRAGDADPGSLLRRRRRDSALLY